MSAPIIFTRPTFSNNDSLSADAFNALTVVSGIVPDAEAGAYGVLRLAGDLTGNAASPALTLSGVTAGTYGATGDATSLKVPTLTVDAKGRVTAASERALGTAYGASLLGADDAATAQATLLLNGTTFLNGIYAAVMARQYPVGEMLITRRSGNPSTWLGFGTWNAYGQGRTLVGLDAGQGEFTTLDQTGGEKTHTLTATEMPSHTHSLSISASISENGGHTHRIFADNSTTIYNENQGFGRTGNRGVSGKDIGQTYITNNQAGTAIIEAVGPHGHNISASGSASSAGSDATHNNLQPYIVVYFWKRTA